MSATRNSVFVKVRQAFSSIFWCAESFHRLWVQPETRMDGEVNLVKEPNCGILREIFRYIVTCSRNIQLILWDLDINDFELLPDN